MSKGQAYHHHKFTSGKVMIAARKRSFLTFNKNSATQTSYQNFLP